MSTLEGQSVLDVLEIKPERPDSGAFDTDRGDSQQKDDKEAAEVETGRQEEERRGDLWMQ